jgi:hypothetical protein
MSETGRGSGLDPASRIRRDWAGIDQLIKRNLPARSLEHGLPFAGKDHAGRLRRWVVMNMPEFDGTNECSYPAVIAGAEGDAYYLPTDGVPLHFSAREHTVRPAGPEALEEMAAAGEVTLRALRNYLGLA